MSVETPVHWRGKGIHDGTVFSTKWDIDNMLSKSQGTTQKQGQKEWEYKDKEKGSGVLTSEHDKEFKVTSELMLLPELGQNKIDSVNSQ